jgi:hypothetical protein
MKKKNVKRYVKITMNRIRFFLVHIPYNWNIRDFDRDIISKVITEYLQTLLYCTVLCTTAIYSLHHVAILSTALRQAILQFTVQTKLHYTRVHCTAHHCTVLHFTVQHINLLNILCYTYCTAHNCTALYRTALYRTAHQCNAHHCTADNCTSIHCTLTHFTLLHNTVLRVRTFELSRIADKPYTRDGDGDLHRK